METAKCKINTQNMPLVSARARRGSAVDGGARISGALRTGADQRVALHRA